LFGILNFGYAQRRRLRRVLLFVCFLGFVIWNFNKSMNFQQSKSPLGIKQSLALWGRIFIGVERYNGKNL
jgi:hypothetical protein